MYHLKISAGGVASAPNASSRSAADSQRRLVQKPLTLPLPAFQALKILENPQTCQLPISPIDARIEAAEREREEFAREEIDRRARAAAKRERLRARAAALAEEKKAPKRENEEKQEKTEKIEKLGKTVTIDEEQTISLTIGDLRKLLVVNNSRLLKEFSMASGKSQRPQGKWEEKILNENGDFINKIIQEQVNKR